MDAPNQNPIEPIPAQDSTHGDSKVAKSKDEPAPRIIAETEFPPSETENSKTRKRRRKIAGLRKAGVFWLEIGTFIVLVAYATITKNQWQTALQATSATQLAASVAQAQLGKMEESNRINRESLETVQRAFVTFGSSPEIVTLPLLSGPIYLIEMPMENAGNTQAHGLIDRVSWIPTMGPLSENYTFPDRTGKYGMPWVATGANIIPAKGSMLSQELRIEQKYFQEFIQQNNGPWLGRFGMPDHPTRNIYFYGWATYRDIFNDTPEHLSEFCRYLTGFIVQPQHVQSSWSYCPWHNCTDEDCPDYKKRIQEAHTAPKCCPWFKNK